MGLLDDAIREHLDLKRRRGADPSEIAREEQEALGPPRRSAEPLAAPAPGHARVEPKDEEDDGWWEPDGAAEDAPTAFGRPLGEDPTIGARGGGLSPIEVRHVDDGEEDSADVGEEPVGLEAVEPPLPEPEPVWQAPPPEPELLDELALVEEGDELDVDEFIGGETDEFAFEDEDFFGDELETPSPAAHEPPFEPFAGPPAPAPQPPAPPAPEPPASVPFADPEPEPPRPPEGDQPTQQYSVADFEEATHHRGAESEPGDEEESGEGEDLLEETPEFLEETPEHDRLWFEQKPPRDFDF